MELALIIGKAALATLLGLGWLGHYASALKAEKEKNPIGVVTSLGLGLQITILLYIMWETYL